MLRKLTISKSEGTIAVICLIVFSMFVNINLILSLNLKNKKENQTNQANQINQKYQINQINHKENNSNGWQEGIGVIKCVGDCANLLGPIGIPILLILLPFLIVDFYIEMHKVMGQKNSGYCSLIFLSIVQFGMSIFCFCIIFHIIGIISLVLFLVNLLTILIPNLDCIKRQKNNDIEYLYNNSKFGTPETMVIQENEFNNILINDKIL